MTPEELNAAKFALDQRRFRFERAKAKLEQRFLFRHSAVLISGAISLATIAISIASIVSSTQLTERNYDNQHAETVRKANAEAEETKRVAAETERKASLDLLQYITANYDLIFSQATDKQIRIRNSMISAFPKVALERVFAHFAETAPTKDGPNVWQEDQRKDDVAGVLGDPPMTRVESGLHQRPTTREELIKALTGPQRRLEAERLAGLPKEQAAATNALLISSLLPQTDRWSYRFNLYAAFTLAKVSGKWTGTRDQYNSVVALKNSGNYEDSTFRFWVDAALLNCRITRE